MAKKKQTQPAEPKLPESNINKKVQFTAVRIMRGNPVKGLLVSEDDSSIVVKLDHYIEGISTGWDEGEERSFRKDLIKDFIILNP